MDTPSSQAVPVGTLAEFHPSSGELRLEHRVVRLRPHTALVLKHLLANPGRVLGKEELLQAAWQDVVVTENSLAQCIAEIRRALGAAGRRAIETVPRRGYRFHPPLVRPAAPARRLLQGAAAALCAALVASAAFWWHLSTRPSAPAAEPLPRLSLAVLPLAADTGDPEQTEFAARITEVLATDLSRLPGVRVIDPRQAGRGPSVRYRLEGGVVREAGRLRVDLRLTEADTGARRWSEAVDLDAGLLQVDSRDVPGRLARMVQVELAADLAPDPALQAWRLWMRGTPEDNAAARELARQAVTLDPESVLGWRVLAASHLLDRSEGWSADPEGALDRAEAAARRAQALNPRHPQVHVILGAVMAMRGRYDEALAALEAELAMGLRHDPLVHEWLGITYVLMGKPRQAIQPLETAVWLSPRDPRLSGLWRALAIAHMHIGDLCFARDRAWSAVRTPRPSPRAYETLAAVCTLYGDSDCAQEAIKELLRIEPRYRTLRASEKVSSKEPEFVTRQQDYMEALRTAGLR